MFLLSSGKALFPQEKRAKDDPGKKNVQPIKLIRSSETEYLNFGQGKGGVIIFRGGISIYFKDNILNAETIKFNPQTGEIFGEGNVKWSGKDQQVTGDYFLFNNKSQTGTIFKGKTKLKQVFYYGDSIKQYDHDSFLVKLAFFTTCDLENPHYYFEAKKVWIYPNNQITAIHVLYNVADIPVFYWPLIFQTDLGTGILTFYGNNRERGHYFQNTYYFSLPFFSGYDIMPAQSKIFFDYYQHTGELYGLYLLKNSRNINYEIDLELANFRKRDQTCNFVFSDKIPCEEITTNFYLSEDGSVIGERQLWWKIDTNFQAQWGKRNGLMQHISLEILEMRHRNFNPEFGLRNEPKNTFEMISFAPTFTISGTNEFDWRAEYAMNWPQTYLSIQLERKLIWYQRNNESDSRYLPALDTIPRLQFSSRWEILEPTDTFFKGSQLSLLINGDITRTLTEGQVEKLIYRGDAALANLYQFVFLSWLSFSPSFSYGLQYRTTDPVNSALDLESRRYRLHFLSVKSPLRIGKSFLYFLTEHEYGYYFLREFPDPTFKDQGLHFLNFLLKSDLNQVFIGSVQSRRDLRKYPYKLPERFRWSPLKLFSELHYSIFGTSTKEDSLIYFFLNNEYRYLIRYKRHGTNDAFIGLSFKDHDLPLLKHLNETSLSIGWHHDFIDLRQDDLVLRFNLDILIFSDWRFLYEMSSRADQIERFQEDKSFFKDLIDGLNPSQSASTRDTVFNLESLKLTLEHRLHKWLLRLSYQRFRRSVFWGRNLENRAAFYEQGVFVSLTLTDLDFFNTPKVQVYRDSPEDQF